MTDTAQLKRLLKHSGYKLEHAARVMGINAATLRSRLNGGTEFKITEAEKLAALLKLTAAQREQCFFGPESKGERREANDARPAPPHAHGDTALRPKARPSRARQPGVG